MKVRDDAGARLATARATGRDRARQRLRVRALSTLCVAALSCGAPAKLVEPAPRAEDWCFRLSAEHYGVVHTARACADSAELCAFAQDRAVAFAGLAHFTEVGACRLVAR